jgi:membrane protein YqaA with SNARE-associated domain
MLFVLARDKFTKKNIAKVAIAGSFLGIVTIGSALLVRSFMPDMAALGRYGYAGTFLLGFVINATVLLPPVLMGVTFPPVAEFASQANFAFVAGAYAAGATLGELSGYAVGRGGIRFLKAPGSLRESSLANNALARKLRYLLRKSWLWIVLLAIVPFPPFDTAGIVAGAMRYPVWKFLIACFAGRVVKYVVVLFLWEFLWRLL